MIELRPRLASWPTGRVARSMHALVVDGTPVAYLLDHRRRRCPRACLGRPVDLEAPTGAVGLLPCPECWPA